MVIGALKHTESGLDHLLKVLPCALIIFFCLSGLSSAQFVNPGFDGGISGWTASVYHGMGAYPDTGDVRFDDDDAPYSDAYASISQTANFTGAGGLTFRICSVYAPSNMLFTVSVDGSVLYSKSSWSGVTRGSYFNVTVPFSDSYIGSHTVTFRANANPSGSGILFMSDAILNYSVAPPVSGSVFGYTSPFEYSETNMYVVSLINGGSNTPYYIDLYKLNNTAYTFSNTISFNNTVSGSNQVEFTVPSGDYDRLYAVLRTAGNVTLANSTDVVVNTRDAYLKFVPSTISPGNSTTLYYGYDYHLNIPRAVSYDIYWTYFWNRGSTYGQFKDELKYHVGNVSDVTGSGSYSIPYTSLPLWGALVPQHYTYCLSVDNRVATSADLYVINDTITPTVPQYTAIVDPAQNISGTDVPNIPGVPDSYKSPSYPSPSSPSNPYSNDYNSNYDNNYNYNSTTNTSTPSTTYNSSSGSWQYNNSTGSGEGYYPSSVPGNVSVDTSIFSGYYKAVDNAYAPLNSTAFGFVGFALSPINSITGYVVAVNSTFTSSTSNLVTVGVLSDIIFPISSGLPAKYMGLIIFSLVISLICFILTSNR